MDVNNDNLICNGPNFPVLQFKPLLRIQISQNFDKKIVMTTW